MKLNSILFLILSATTATSYAENINKNNNINAGKPDVGWHFGEDPILAKKKEKEQQQEQPQPEKQEQPKKEVKKENPCVKAETWTKNCGFVDPGNDYDFQAKQRDALLQAMSMTKNDPEVVKQFQLYMNWVTGQAVKVANMWQYNMLQNPELDPTLQLPTNTFGINLMEEATDKAQKDVFASLKDISKLVYFSQADCSYCHSFAPIVRNLSKDTGLSYTNLPIDGKCVSEKENCLVTDKAQQVAGMLKISVVPSLYLLIEPNLWLKISHGVNDVATLKARIKNFVTMYKNALKKGIANGGSNTNPTLDFSADESPIGSKNIDVNKNIKLPTEDEIKALFNGSKK